MIPFATSTPAIQTLAHALGWTLLHFLWQGTLIALVLACVLALLSDRSPQPRYLASCCALLLMILLPLVTFARLIAASRANASAITLTLDVIGFGEGHGGPLSQPVLEHIAQSLDQAMPTVLAIWTIGVALLFARLTLGLIIARRMKSATTQLPPNELLVTFQQIAHRIGVGIGIGTSRPVRLLQSALDQVPTVIGWLRPVVLIPIGCLSGLSTEQVEAILAHELAHIRRHDYLVSVLQSIVEALLFYHPAVWWVSQQIRRDREHCCDDLAVNIGGNPLTYARALSLLEEHRSTLPAIALGANGGTLTMRIKRLLGTSQNPAISQLAALTLFGIVLLATAVCITTAARAQSSHALPATMEVHRLATGVHSAAVSNEARSSAGLSQQAPSASNPRTISESTSPRTQSDQILCALKVFGNRSISSNSILSRLLSKRGDRYNPVRVERDMDTLANTGYFDAIQIQRIDSNQCVQLAVYVQEKPQPRPIAVAYTPQPQSQPQSPTPDTPRHVSGGVMAGQILFKVNPIYPPDAKADHIEGAVVLSAVISTTGTVENLKVVSGPIQLAPSAIDAVRQWKYKPYLLNGMPTEVETTITINYHLNTDPPPGDPQASNDEPTNPALTPRKIGNGVSAPVVISTADPSYTPEAREAKTSGNVLLALQVEPTGIPSHIRVVRGIGNGLDEKAIEAVKQYKFKPAMEAGKPVPVQLNIEVNFKIF